MAALGACVTVALAATAFFANPFAMYPHTPGDGRGLDPILRNPLMGIQPPLMFLGIACAAVAIVVAASALMRGRFEGGPFAAVRAAALVSWGLLGAAIVLGARWAYVTPELRALAGKHPAAIAGVTAWSALTVFLVMVEWRHASRGALAEADLMRRRAGRFVGAAGLALCLAPLAARPLTRNYDAQIGDGERYRAKDAWGREWTFTSEGLSRLEREGDDVVSLALMPTRDGKRQPFVASESRQYYGAGGLDIYPAQTVPGIRSTIAQDLFVVLADAGEGRAVLRISFRTLVELLWTGGVLLTVGGLLLFWPPRPEYAP